MKYRKQDNTWLTIRYERQDRNKDDTEAPSYYYTTEDKTLDWTCSNIKVRNETNNNFLVCLCVHCLFMSVFVFWVFLLLFFSYLFLSQFFFFSMPIQSILKDL